MDKIKTNIYNMLRYRGIEHLTDNDLNKFKDNNDKEYFINDNIMIFFVDALNKKVALKIENDMIENKITHSIIISDKITHTTKKYIINNLNTKEFLIEMFLYQELKINISEHILVRKHKIIDNNTKSELLNKYKIVKEMLPQILITDPMCRYVGGKLGDIIQINRNEETIGNNKYFRLVVRE